MILNIAQCRIDLETLAQKCGALDEETMQAAKNYNGEDRDEYEDEANDRDKRLSEALRDTLL